MGVFCGDCWWWMSSGDDGVDYCREYGPCCMISRFQVDLGNVTFHIGEDLISLLSTIELFMLLMLLVCSYARLDNSILRDRGLPKFYILPIYFLFVIMLALWYSVEVLLILLPNVKDSFFISVLYDGHAFFDNFLIIFSFFPNADKNYSIYSLLMSLFLMTGSISLSYFCYEPNCDYCSLFFPSNSQVYLWLALTVIYFLLLTLVTIEKLQFIPYKPRVTLKLWLLFLFCIYLILSFGAGLVTWVNLDAGFCIISVTEMIFVLLYGPLLFYTLVMDSRRLYEKPNCETLPILSLNVIGKPESQELVPMESPKEERSKPLFFKIDMGDNEEVDPVQEAKKIIENIGNRSVRFIDLSAIKFGRKIGSGSMGEVYYATWNHTAIAVKRIFQSDQALTDWIKEVNALTSISHPNVLLFLGVSVHDNGDRCIITEYVDGGSVFDLLYHTEENISHAQIHQILKGTAIGVSYLHDFEIPLLHRDLKSHNILIDSISGNVKIADFGLSRPAVDNTMTPRTGTPQWTAPEVTRSEKYSTKADVYSYGIVIFEVLTRQKPFHTMPCLAAAYDVAFKGLRPEFPIEIVNEYPQYVDLAKRCWRENPDERPSFKEIVEFLQNCCNKF